jgi:hypothetical protein
MRLARQAHEDTQKSKGLKEVPLDISLPLIKASWAAADLEWLLMLEPGAEAGKYVVDEAHKDEWFMIVGSAARKETRGKVVKAPLRPLRKAIRERGKQIVEAGNEVVVPLKKEPKFQSVEFKCVNDYDNCIAHRGDKRVLCALALIICVSRRLIPFVRQS